MLIVYIERSESIRLSKSVCIDASAALEFEPILVVSNTELRLYYILNKDIEALLEMSSSDIGIISEVRT